MGVSDYHSMDFSLGLAMCMCLCYTLCRVHASANGMPCPPLKQGRVFPPVSSLCLFLVHATIAVSPTPCQGRGRGAAACAGGDRWTRARRGLERAAGRRGHRVSDPASARTYGGPRRTATKRGGRARGTRARGQQCGVRCSGRRALRSGSEPSPSAAPSAGSRHPLPEGLNLISDRGVSEQSTAGAARRYGHPGPGFFLPTGHPQTAGLRFRFIGPVYR
jgi:hypothetical protein